MNERKALAVDDYFADLFVGRDPALDATVAACTKAGLPSIAVSPVQGKLLFLLAQMAGAERILEIGTLGGYSAIWMARALPSTGRLITLEIDPHHAEVAKRNIESAGLGGLVDIELGPALATLERMGTDRVEPFDLIFIDADKRNNPHYLRWALEVSHPGTTIVVDNVVRDGRVTDANTSDADVRGTRDVLKMLATEPRISATAIQTVGHKGYDGFAIAYVKH